MLEKIPFRELSQFKEESNDSEQQLYTFTKSRVIRYRAIFLTIGIIFLFLAWVIESKSAMWLTAFTKPAVELIALLLGLASLSICAFLRYETEAVRSLYHHSVGRLSVSYKIRNARTFKNAHLPFFDLMRKKLAMRSHYKQTIEKLKRLELDSLDLMDKISHTHALTLDEKENLYNQALLELKTSYIPIIQKYESFREQVPHSKKGKDPL